MQVALERQTLENLVELEVVPKPKIAVETPQVDYKKIFSQLHRTEMVEFTLAAGCPVQCQRYCPQEVFMKKYGRNTSMMSFSSFKQILSHMPTNVDVTFAGFCEPFVNPDFVRMAEYAYYNGYRLHMYTTLFGAKTSDVERLLNLEYSHFCLHIRDGHIVDFPLTPEYQHNVFRVIEGLPNVTICLMNELFVSNNRENVTRGKKPQPKRVGFCQKLVTPQFVVLPNGSVQLCCMDFGLKHTVGNLLKEDYATIKKRFMEKNNFYPLCSYCSSCVPYTRVIYNKMVSKAKKVAHRVVDRRLALT